MAGLAFRIEKWLKKRESFTLWPIYFHSSLVLSVPWIITILALCLIHLMRPDNLSVFQFQLLRGTLIYIFAYSFILTGFWQIVLTRYLSIKLFSYEPETILPTLNSSVLITLLTQVIFGTMIIARMKLDYLIGTLTLVLLLTMSLVWLLIIFLANLKKFRAVILSFAFGCATSFYLAKNLGMEFQMLGYLTGIFLGAFLTATLLSFHVFSKYQSKYAFDFAFFQFIGNNKTLLMIGFLYALSFWIDKIVFWYRQDALLVLNAIRLFPEYDEPVFYAYLTILPTLSFFLLRLEGNIFKKVKGYFQAILDRRSFDAILKAKKEIIVCLRQNIQVLILLQGTVTFLCVAFVPYLSPLLGLEPTQVPVFRIALLGSFLHGIFLILIIMILYFDFKGLALFLIGLFCFLNAAFAVLVSYYDIIFSGYGYFLASFISLFIGYYLFERRFRRLEYYQFAMQPIEY